MPAPSQTQNPQFRITRATQQGLKRLALAHGMPMTQVAEALVYKALLKENLFGDDDPKAMFPNLAFMADDPKD